MIIIEKNFFFESGVKMKKTGSLISNMISYYSGDVKRINHFLKVYSFAKAIGENECLEDTKQEILEIAAIVHDIGIKASELKYNSSSGKYQQIEGPEIAEEMLKNLEYHEMIISRVCFLIAHHHIYKDIDDIDYQILIEADFLVNIAEDSLPLKSIHKINEQLFKTDTGKMFLQHLYLS